MLTGGLLRSRETLCDNVRNYARMGFLIWYQKNVEKKGNQRITVE